MKKTISLILTISVAISLFAFALINASAQSEKLVSYENVSNYNETVTEIEEESLYYETEAKALEETLYYETEAKALEETISPTNIDGITGDCTWKIEGTKLTISGNGKMGSYDGYAPWHNYDFTEAVLEKGVTTIGKNAFYGCYSLTKVTIPDTVKSIGNNSFKDCTRLTIITIPDSVTMIGSTVFYGCTKLKSITIPNSVTNIEWGTFYGCTGLTRLIIGNSVKSIGIKAFNYCTSLTGVHITDIGAWCSISFEDYYDNPLYYAHNLYLNDNLITKLAIPDYVEKIHSYAFFGCEGLKSVTIPASVTSIGSTAFGYYYDVDFERVFKVSGFTIYGYKYTAAERYANSNGFTFIALDDQPTEPTQAPTVEPSDPTKTTDREIFGDIDGDGVITVVDSTFLQRYTIHAETPYPIGEKMK